MFCDTCLKYEKYWMLIDLVPLFEYPQIWLNIKNITTWANLTKLKRKKKHTACTHLTFQKKPILTYEELKG